MVSLLGVTGLEAKLATPKICQTVEQRHNFCDSGAKVPTHFRELHSASLLSLLSILTSPVLRSTSTLYRVLTFHILFTGLSLAHSLIAAAL